MRQLVRRFIRISDIKQYGTSPEYSLFENRKIILVNQISLIFLFIVLAHCVFSFLIGQLNPVFIDMVAIAFILIPVLILNKNGWPKFARGYFLIGTFMIIVGGAIISILGGLSTESENVLIIFIFAIIVLLEKKAKQIGYAISMVVLFTLKFFKYYYLQLPLDGQFYLTILNFMTIMVGLYLAASFYKDTLINSLEVTLLSKEVLEQNKKQLDDQNKQLEKQRSMLEVSNTTKDKLFNIIAHDIKSPLSLFHSILGIQDEDLSKDDFKAYKKQVKEKLSNLNRTIDNLLHWSRSQLDGIKPAPQKVEIGPIIRDNTALFQDLISKKSIHLDHHNGSGLHVYMDKNHLQIVLRNILHNALKFTRSDGKIQVNTVEQKTHISISVEDDGVGMNQEEIARIMEQKMETSRDGTEGELGTGIGLNLCAELISMNDGTMEIYSEVDKGTRVVLNLPKHVHINPED